MIWDSAVREIICKCMSQLYDLFLTLYPKHKGPKIFGKDEMKELNQNRSWLTKTLRSVDRKDKSYALISLLLSESRSHHCRRHMVRKMKF